MSVSSCRRSRHPVGHKMSWNRFDSRLVWGGQEGCQQIRESRISGGGLEWEQKLGWKSRFGRQSRKVIASALGADKMLWKEARLQGPNLGEFHHSGAGEGRGKNTSQELGVGVAGEVTIWCHCNHGSLYRKRWFQSLIPTPSFRVWALQSNARLYSFVPYQIYSDSWNLCNSLF